MLLRPNLDFGPPARTAASYRHICRYGSEHDTILPGAVLTLNI